MAGGGWMFVFEVSDESYGGIVVNNNPGGAFESTDGQDLWSWRDTWFPVQGWRIAFGNGSVRNADVTFTSYAFDTDPQVPSSKFGGNVFRIEKNGVIVGWLEAYVSGGQARLMWWSNGQCLNRDRKIRVDVGDTLLFDPASLPSSKQYPLKNIQG
jgi:hypothetical protein